MKRYILFSNPSTVALGKVLSLMFPTNIQNKVVGYVPPNGTAVLPQYNIFWEEKVKKYGGEILFIDVTKKESVDLLSKVQILLLTGGNTFEFLYNLQRNNL